MMSVPQELYDAVYDRLHKSLPYLKEVLNKMDKRDPRTEKLVRMYDLISRGEKLRYQNLLKCEEIIKKIKNTHIKTSSVTDGSSSSLSYSISLLKNAAKLHNEKKRTEERSLVPYPSAEIETPAPCLQNIWPPINPSTEIETPAPCLQNIWPPLKQNLGPFPPSDAVIPANEFNAGMPNRHFINNNTPGFVNPPLPPMEYASMTVQQTSVFYNMPSYQQQPVMPIGGNPVFPNTRKDPRINSVRNQDFGHRSPNSLPINTSIPPPSILPNPIPTRRKSLHISHPSTTPTSHYQRRMSVAPNKYNSPEIREKEPNEGEFHVYGNNVDKLLTFDANNTTKQNSKIDEMYKKINTETFKDTPLMGKSSFTSSFKIPKLNKKSNTAGTSKVSIPETSKEPINTSSEAKKSEKKTIEKEKVLKAPEAKPIKSSNASENKLVKKKKPQRISSDSNDSNDFDSNISKKSTNSKSKNESRKSVESMNTEARKSVEAMVSEPRKSLEAKSKSRKSVDTRVIENRKSVEARDSKKSDIKEKGKKSTRKSIEEKTKSKIAKTKSKDKDRKLSARESVDSFIESLAEEDSPKSKENPSKASTSKESEENNAKTTMPKEVQKFLDSLNSLNIDPEKINMIKEIIGDKKDEKEVFVRPKTPPPVPEKKTIQQKSRKKGKNELEKLNADIDFMYDRDQIVSAGGKRSCTKNPKRYNVEIPLSPVKKRKMDNKKKKTQTTRKSIGTKTKQIVKKNEKPKNKTRQQFKMIPTDKVSQTLRVMKRLEIVLPRKINLKNVRIMKKKSTAARPKKQKSAKKKPLKLVISKDKPSNKKPTRRKSTLPSKKSPVNEVKTNARKRRANTMACGETPKKGRIDKKPVDKKEKSKKSRTESKTETTETNTVPKVVKIRNNRVEMHSQSDYLSSCIFGDYSMQLSIESTCLKHYKMIEHYFTKHPGEPIYLSRFSKQKSDIIKYTEVHKPKGTLEGQHILDKCNFCDTEHNFTKDQWIDHLSRHTGEYKYSCTKCGLPSNTSTHEIASSCEHDMKQINNLSFEENQLNAYLCRQCNFIQISHVNIQKHWDDEHKKCSDLNHDLKFCLVGYVQKVKRIELNIEVPLPIVKKEEVSDPFDERKEIQNFGYNIVRQTKWFLCLYPDCRFMSITSEELLMHASDTHTEISWNGMCIVCDRPESSKTVPLQNEMQHLLMHMEGRNEIEMEEPTPEPNNVAIKAEVDETPIIINVKCWLDCKNFKSFPHAKEQTTPKSLCSLFKCMGKMCAFTCEDPRKMQEHLKNHELVSIGDNSWLDCAYCQYASIGSSELVEHLLQSHKDSKYQCSLCFYRSAESCSVLVHQDIYHKGKEAKILINDATLLNVLVKENTNEMNQNKEKNIKPLHCPECDTKHWKLNLYFHHLLIHTDNKIKCFICSMEMHMNDLVKHLTIHMINIYQCLFCEFGALEKRTMKNHIVNMHPDRNLFTYIRTKRSDVTKNKKEINDLFVSDDYYYLGENVESTKFGVCSFTPSELNFKSVDTKSNCDINYDKSIRLSVSSQFPMPLKNTPVPSSASNNTRQIESIVAKPLELDKIAYESAMSFSYNCTYEDCEQKYKKLMELHNHMNKEHKDATEISCNYCSNIFNSVKGYVGHLKKHDPTVSRYFCYMSDFSDTTAKSVEAHLKKEHKIGNTKHVFYNSDKNDPDKDLVIVCPVSCTQTQLTSFYQNQIHFYKRSYHHTETSLLPPTQVWRDKIYCTDCGYPALVRLQMIRHLKDHANK